MIYKGQASSSSTGSSSGVHWENVMAKLERIFQLHIADIVGKV